MDNVYPINLHPLSGMPMKPAEHKRTMTAFLIVILAVAFIGGVWYWTSVSRTSPATTTAKPDIRAQVAALLMSSPVHASQADINNVVSLLKKTNTKVSDSDRQAVARELAE